MFDNGEAESKGSIEDVDKKEDQGENVEGYDVGCLDDR